MSFAYLPLYTGDYLRDTQHLSCSEHGIYLKFLMHCWDQKGPLPLDERKQQGICNARSGDEIEAMRRVRAEFFVQMEDGWYNARMQREIERAENISVERSRAGKIGYQARAKQLPSKSQALASIPTPTPILPLPPEEKNILSGLPKKQANADAARRVLEFLNSTAGKRFRLNKVNLSILEARLEDGITEDQLRKIVVRKAREWLPDDKMRQYLQPKTLFNRTNCENYLGNLIPPTQEKTTL